MITLAFQYSLVSSIINEINVVTFTAVSSGDHILLLSVAGQDHAMFWFQLFKYYFLLVVMGYPCSCPLM